MIQSNLEQEFHKHMLAIYRKGLDLREPYRATRFKKMVEELGGKAAADKLLSSAKPSEGFTELILHGGSTDALKISVEYPVLTSPWNTLFTDEQLEKARKRLIEVNGPLAGFSKPIN